MRRAAVCHQAAWCGGVAVRPLEGVDTRYLLAPLRCSRDRIDRCAARDPGSLCTAPSFHAAREIVSTCRDGDAPMRWSHAGIHPTVAVARPAGVVSPERRCGRATRRAACSGWVRMRGRWVRALSPVLHIGVQAMPQSMDDSGDTARLTADPRGWRSCGKRSPPGVRHRGRQHRAVNPAGAGRTPDTLVPASRSEDRVPGGEGEWLAGCLRVCVTAGHSPGCPWRLTFRPFLRHAQWGCPAIHTRVVWRPVLR